MENLCHTLTGWALARAGLGKLSPLATTTCVVAANLPDADVVVLAWGELMYLEHHRGVTHALPGLVLQAVLLPALVWLADRARARGRPDAARANFAGLFAASAAGLASHFALDWTNSYGVRPFLPFDRTWFYGDLVYIVDPWIWLILAGSLFLGGGRTRRTLAGWLALFAVMASVVVLAAAALAADVGVAPGIWLAALATLLVARWARPALSPATFARAGLVGYLLYVAGLSALHWAAVDRVVTAAEPLARSGEIVLASDALPLPMRPDLWKLYVLTPASVHSTTDDLIRGMGDWDETRRNLREPEARAALDTCPGALAAHFGRYLRAEITGGDEKTSVELVDDRFPKTRGRRAVGQIRVELGPDLRPAPDPRQCPRF